MQTANETAPTKPRVSAAYQIRVLTPPELDALREQALRAEALLLHLEGIADGEEPEVVEALIAATRGHCDAVLRMLDVNGRGDSDE